MSFLTFYSADPVTRQARGTVMGFESPLLPRAAIEKWARENVGGWWRLKKCGGEFYDHQLWELERGATVKPKVKGGKTISGRFPVLWKIITTMRLQRSKVRAPIKA